MAKTTEKSGDQPSSRREALVREADMQTRAIMRLEVWKRLSYSMIAVGVLLGYWNLEAGGPDWAFPLAIVLLVVLGLTSVVLYLGVSRAKENVKHILDAADVDLDARHGDARDDDSGPSAASPKTADAKSGSSR